MKTNSKIQAAFFSAFLLTVIFFSCSRSEPRIQHGFIDLVYYEGMDGVEERYSFFVLSEDDDGAENLMELYLYHDREGLRWLISSENWVRHNDEGRTWIGSRSIAMTENVPLPRGQYRAVLINKGGERAERNFTFDGPVQPPHAFPSFTIIDEVYRVNSQYPVNRFIFYDQQGRVADIRTISESEGYIGDLNFSGGARTAALWAEDPNYQISTLSSAAPIR